MAVNWSGDGTYYLPARQVEPYRLWFEFLKQAHRDPDIDVNYDHYRDWGDFHNKDFGEWWSGATWRTLFAIDAGVRLIDENESFVNDGNSITVRLPLGKDPKETLKDVKQLLEQHEAGIGLSSVVQGKYALSQGYEKAFLKHLKNVNLMLRLYRIWLDNIQYAKNDRIIRTATEFSNWAQGRKEMIESKGYKYPIPLLPFAVEAYVMEHQKGYQTFDSNERRQFMRYLRKARNLAENAATGVFPGKY